MAVDFLTGDKPILAETGFPANASAAFDSGATGSDRALVVFVFYENGGDPGITDIQYGGVSLTKQLEQVVSPGDNFSETVEVWTLVNPTTGSNTLALTNSSTSQDGAVLAAVYTGVDQTTPVGDTNSVARQLSTDGTFTLSKTSEDDGAVWGVVQDRGDTSITAATDNTKRVEEVNFGDATTGCVMACGDRLVGSGTVTVGATFSGSGSDAAAAGLVFNAASTGGSESGSGALEAQASTLDGAGGVSRSGSGVLSAQASVTAGTGARGSNGTGVFAAQDSVLDGVAVRESTGSGSLAAQIAELSGTALPTSTAQGELVAGATVLTVSATVARMGSATLQAATAALEASVQVEAATTTGEGALEALPAFLSATGDAYSVLTGDGTLLADNASLEASGLVFIAASGALESGLAVMTGEGGVALAPRTGEGQLVALTANLDAGILRTVKASGAVSADPAETVVHPWIELHTQDSQWTVQKADWGEDL